MTTQLPPDYEDRHTLALALCQHLDINPQHVELGSLHIELGPDAQHQVTWTGHTHLDLADLTGILMQAMQAKLRDPTPPDHPDAYPPTDRCPSYLNTDHEHPGTPHRCHRPNGHHGNHQCITCVTVWEPNQA